MTQPKHEIDGYKAGASGYRHKCRCDDCKASNKVYQRKHRTTDDTPTAERPIIVEPVKESVITIPTPEIKSVTITPVVVIPTRDEGVPYQILEALDSSDAGDTAIYEDSGEGWKLEELALILPGMANVACQIRGHKLYVREIIDEVTADVPIPMTTLAPMTIAAPQRNSNYPAQPRVTPKTPIPAPARPRLVANPVAPTVPSTAYRAPMNATRNANTAEPFSL